MVLGGEDASPSRISFTVRSRLSAPNEFGIEFAYCSISMIVTRNESQIAAVTSPEFKGAGNSSEQAARNAAKLMLEAFAKDPALEEAISVLLGEARRSAPISFQRSCSSPA